MSLLLLAGYGSSSSESESECELENKSRQQRQKNSSSGDSATATDISHAEQKAANQKPPQRALGVMLSSILPPPKFSSEKKTIRIMVDLPQSKLPATSTETNANTNSDPETDTPADSAKRSSSGLFSELSSLLPAPKNLSKGPALSSQAVSNMPLSAHAVDVTPKPEFAQQKPQALIPHSLSNRRKGKTTAIAARSFKAPISSGAAVEAGYEGAGDTSRKQPQNLVEGESFSGPFFTIDADGPTEVNNFKTDNDINEGLASNNANQGNQAAHTAPELYYDPTSGYYYDYVSGLYYFYDAASKTYIDARNIAPSDNHEHGVHGLEPGNNGDPSISDSGIAKHDIGQMIGRKGLRRGEMHAMFSGPVKHVSQSTQLQNSGYSDTRAAAEFSVKRSAEQKRRQTQTVIDSSEVDKKKKQKHNIMFLALQAQEQETKLKEAHASRQRSKKAARAKYGKFNSCIVVAVGIKFHWQHFPMKFLGFHVYSQKELACIVYACHSSNRKPYRHTLIYAFTFTYSSHKTFDHA
ncbi:hypothetical protein LPJ66_004841 [Kickxella alabastrina]|uniref:Uncharacterized protein n=1 Tax=Kickxella alabastrina TaxID=61397 RepID=A0ACC1IG85_9FUNG|nr:hypothetical protein LPJ66_004841 [Kickxella alabastrina]